MERIKGAVYIGYNENTDVVPSLITKGYGDVAEEILRVAFEKNIFVYRDPKLFESLIKLETGSEIPVRLYVIIAKILAFISVLKNEREVLYD